LGQAQAVPPAEQGRALYRSNCAFCHGLDGKGGRGPNLVAAPLNHGDSDSDIANDVRGGVPGSTMPAFTDIDDQEMAQLVLFLRQLAGGAPRKIVHVGDASAGRAVYERSGCEGCHRIGNRGSVFGPELTRIGAARSIEYLRDSIVKPSADIPSEYEAVTIVTATGSRISGIRINEDPFTIQLRDSAQKFRSFAKNTLKEVVHEKTSAMPSYTQLNETDLNNLLEYLVSLRAGAAGQVKAAEGIR
jgi:putative heme-binding domain-containing protein